jgi:hypothetical protein
MRRKAREISSQSALNGIAAVVRGVRLPSPDHRADAVEVIVAGGATAPDASSAHQELVFVASLHL